MSVVRGGMGAMGLGAGEEGGGGRPGEPSNLESFPSRLIGAF